MARSKTSKYPLTMRILNDVIELEQEGFEDGLQNGCGIQEDNLFYVAMLAKLELTGQVKYDGKIAKDKKKLDQLIKKAYNLDEEE